MKDKKIIVTGGTSGLGAALVHQFLQDGAKVVSVARTPVSGLPRSASHLFIPADISRAEDSYSISGQAISFLGGVDILINNASYLGLSPLRLLLDTPCEDVSSVLETNVLGPFRLTKVILPQMILSGRGQVVNISSDAAVSAYPRWGAYSAAKAALDHLSKIWGEELRGQGIRFLSVDPGDMDTPMHLKAMPDADRTRLRAPKESARRLIQILQEVSLSGPVRRVL